MLRSMLIGRGGSVATMTGLVFLILVGATGGAVDLSNATNQRIALQSAADASVLASAALKADTTDAERMAAAKKFFVASPFCKENQCDEPVLQMDGPAIVINTTAHVETSLLKAVGWQTIEVGAWAKAVPPSGNPVEVVMMLDYSGSMNSSNKYQDMAEAAVSFLDNITNGIGSYMSVGIVPFSEYVLTPMDGRYLYDVNSANDLTGQYVVGCVLNREHPHSTSVAAPVTSTEGSLWPVFSHVAGGNPEANGYSNDYEPEAPQDYVFTHDGTAYTVRYIDTNPANGLGAPQYHLYAHSGGDDDDDAPVYPHVHGNGDLSMTWVGTNPGSIDFMNALPWNSAANAYGGYAGSEGWSTGSDGGLPPSFSAHQLSEDLSSSCSEYADKTLWLRPLSKDFPGMKAAIEAMEPIGWTNIALALDLGWHVLTPSAPFTEGSSDGDVKRIAILLTDGVQTVKAHGPGGGISLTSANANIAESCAAMKNQGIEIFTIAFGIDDTYTRGLLKNCATDEPHYYEPVAGDQLNGIFDDIYKRIAPEKVRLSG